MYTYVVRAVRADDWASVKALRLLALRDPVADLAFYETYDEAAARPDDFWRERTAGGAEGAAGARQFVAETADGEWAGTVTVLVEAAGSVDWAGAAVERLQGGVVGVFVRAEHRGTGAIEALFEAALEWAWSWGAERVRLVVHEDNGRALACYRRLGFSPTGVAFEEQREIEMAVEPPGRARVSG
ncbi:GNAT family N-acetyltransferase [Streptomyces rishiriensis]|uniref:GNAT family N-acetyltransferase n=1 Tax=Streptomyces rishiriensis TaxID=68264 RepID=UPI000D58F8AA|nr:GNAT family N-acetyltransferase [Streptomyces rishiriensis]